MIAIIQARMSSRRLPGKTLKNINGKPLLLRLVDRLRKSKKITKILIATSGVKEDKKIILFCKKYKISYFSGYLKDVSKRFSDCLKLHSEKYDSFIRISADSPLLDVNLVDKMASIFNKNNYEILTNVFPRSFPKGQSVEIINKKVFLKYETKFKSASDKEHVTKYFYKNPNLFKIKNFKNHSDFSNLNMSVNDIKDLEIVCKIYKELIDKNKKKYFRWKDFIAYF